MTDRHYYNHEILDLISLYLDKYPDQRFTQVLVNLDIAVTIHSKDGGAPTNVVDYNEESKRTLDRMLGLTKDS